MKQQADANGNGQGFGATGDGNVMCHYYKRCECVSVCVSRCGGVCGEW